MLNKGPVFRGVVLGCILLPLWVISSTTLSFFVPKDKQIRTEVLEEINPQQLTTNRQSTLILEDDFDNQAGGWFFSQGTINKWMAGFPNDFLAEGELPLGLFISNDESTFAYTNETAAVSHAYKTVQLPLGIDKIRMSFGWISGGYAVFNEETFNLDPKD